MRGSLQHQQPPWPLLRRLVPEDRLDHPPRQIPKVRQVLQGLQGRLDRSHLPRLLILWLLEAQWVLVPPEDLPRRLHPDRQWVQVDLGRPRFQSCQVCLAILLHLLRPSHQLILEVLEVLLLLHLPVILLGLEGQCFPLLQLRLLRHQRLLDLGFPFLRCHPY